MHLHFLPSPGGVNTKSLSVLEQRQLDTLRFCINMFSACTATIISSPLNYMRNVHYATPPESPQLTVRQVFQELMEQTRLESGIGKQLSFFLGRLRIGWGTARVGVGMAFGSEFYYYCSQAMGHAAS